MDSRGQELSRKDLFRLARNVGVVSIAAAALPSGFAVADQGTPYRRPVTVSRIVRNDRGKSYLEVDGKPYLYQCVQTPAMNTAAGDDNDPHVDLPAAATAGYRTVSFWLRWAALETSPGTWDFSTLDTVIDLAVRNNQRLDIIWGGTNFCTLMDERFTPAWIRENQAYWLAGTQYRADYSNTDLLAAEKAALTTVLDHLRDYDRTHRVVFFQIENEANYAPDWAKIYGYISELGGLIHGSSYRIATRINYWHDVMSPIVNQLPGIDAHGPDPYSTSVDEIRSIITDTADNTKFHYIAENGGYDNATSLMVTAFANGGFYSMYKVEYDYYWNSPGLYGKNYTVTPTTRTVSQLNQAINKIDSIIATAPAGDMLEFNTETDTPVTGYHTTKPLHGVQFGFRTDTQPSVGLVVSDHAAFYLAADGPATLVLDTPPLLADVGSLDESGCWRPSAPRPWQPTGDGHYQLSYHAGEALRVIPNGAWGHA